ncbi:hypothetical protein GE09DRAFT_1220408 [Coniochaeta sp. 2T2.1]|nr:hypothetical protein GE09DRAFT_1220408 [Coniochaeta sp. 2T2.1]
MSTTESRGPRGPISPPPRRRPKADAPPRPSYQVPFFTEPPPSPGQRSSDAIDDYALERGIEIDQPDHWLIAKIALWEFALQPNDKLWSRLARMVKQDDAELIRSTGFRPRFGNTDSRTAIATWFIQEELKARGGQGGQQEEEASPQPSGRVTYFTPNHDRHDARYYATKLDFPTHYSAEETDVALAVWEFSLPLDDPLRDQLLLLVRMSAEGMRKHVGFRTVQSGEDRTRAGVATWFMRKQLEEREEQGDADDE